MSVEILYGLKTRTSYIFFLSARLIRGGSFITSQNYFPIPVNYFYHINSKEVLFMAYIILFLMAALFTCISWYLAYGIYIIVALFGISLIGILIGFLLIKRSNESEDIDFHKDRIIAFVLGIASSVALACFLSFLVFAILKFVFA